MIYCGEGALEKWIDYCQAQQLDRFLLVADENTYRALGQRAEASLKEQGWDVRLVLLSGGEVVADESRLVEVLVAAGNEPRDFCIRWLGYSDRYHSLYQPPQPQPFYLSANCPFGRRLYFGGGAAHPEEL